MERFVLIKPSIYYEIDIQAFRKEMLDANSSLDEEAKSENNSIVYLGTDHTELYEKYGYTYLETRKDYWNDEARIYYKKL